MVIRVLRRILTALTGRVRHDGKLTQIPDLPTVASAAPNDWLFRASAIVGTLTVSDHGLVERLLAKGEA
jgi:hypothetical protein